MKSYLIIPMAAFIFCSVVFSCRGKNDVRISVDDSGQKLDLKVEANKKGKDIDYHRSFDVTGLNKAQRDAIVKHVLDSLGINE